MGFDYIVIAPLLLSHCGFSFVFGCGVSFLVSSSVFLSMIVQQLDMILVFSQEGVRAHRATPPSWFRLRGSLYFHEQYLFFTSSDLTPKALRVISDSYRMAKYMQVYFWFIPFFNKLIYLFIFG